MPLILGWFRMVGTGRLNGSGLILILATVWTCLVWVTSVSVSTLFATLGVLGACVATWRLSDRMFSWTAFMMPLAISVALIGMLLVSLSLPVRKLGLWLVVPLFPLLPLVVGCLIGMVALSLARLNISLGIVLVACVMSLNLPSFVFSVSLGWY